MYCLTVCTGGDTAPVFLQHKSLMILQPREWLLRSAVLFLKGKLAACFLNECLLGHWAWWHALTKLSLNERQRGHTMVQHDRGGTRLSPKLQACACNWGPRAELWHLGSCLEFISVQSLSRVQLFVTPWTAAHQASLSITNFPVQHQSCSNSCPSSQWCHPTISPSVIPFFSHLQSFPASESFLVSQFFTSGGQSIGDLASVSVLPMNIQDRFPLGWTGWISVQFKGLSRVFSNTHSSKASILRCSAFFIVQLSHPYTTTGKTIALTRQNFVGKVMFLFFNMLSRLVTAFLPKSKRLLISWL